MPIAGIIKRASNYILGSDDTNETKIENVYEDNEVLFCKNNVCVHPPAVVRQETDILHYPGYLTVTTKTFTDQYNNAKRNTLLLTWIPNATLRKCPASVENNGMTSIVGHSVSSINSDNLCSYTDELKQHKLYNQISDWDKVNGVSQPRLSVTLNHHTNPFLDPSFYDSTINPNPNTTDTNHHFATLNIACADNMDTNSVSSNSDRASSNGMHSHCGVDNDMDDVFVTSDDSAKRSAAAMADETDDEKQLKRELEPLIETDGNHDAIVLTNAAKQNVKTVLASQQHNQQFLTSVNITIANPQIHNQDLSPDESIEQSAMLMRTQSISSVEETMTNWMTPEMLAFKHNLAFPESVSSSPILTRTVPMKCRRFSVDLSQMRSLRLFFNDENCTSGQLVIASRESQYKILHFHHGGLDHLAQVLHQWHCLLHNIKLIPGNSWRYCLVVMYTQYRRTRI